MQDLKLAISNISWKPTDDEKQVFSLLHQHSVTGIEVAPTKVWSNLDEATDSNVTSYKKYLEDNGFEVPAIQSILYGHPEFQVFKPETHDKMFEHLKKMFGICAGLGGKVAVFGCPKNRCVIGEKTNVSYAEAAEFFNKLGEIAKSAGVVVGIEANPAAYKCNFLNTIDEVDEFVKTHIESAGIKVHFDVGACVMNDEDVCKKIKSIRDFCHFHISTSYLENIADTAVEYPKMFDALREVNYKGWVSIEMKQIDPTLQNIERALRALS